MEYRKIIKLISLKITNLLFGQVVKIFRAVNISEVKGE